MELRLKEVQLPETVEEVQKVVALVGRQLGQDRPYMLQYKDDESGKWVNVPIVDKTDAVVAE